MHYAILALSFAGAVLAGFLMGVGSDGRKTP